MEKCGGLQTHSLTDHGLMVLELLSQLKKRKSQSQLYTLTRSANDLFGQPKPRLVVVVTSYTWKDWNGNPTIQDILPVNKILNMNLWIRREFFSLTLEMFDSDLPYRCWYDWCGMLNHTHPVYYQGALSLSLWAPPRRGCASRATCGVSAGPRVEGARCTGQWSSVGAVCGESKESEIILNLTGWPGTQ